jgi:hypothetical protein
MGGAGEPPEETSGQRGYGGRLGFFCGREDAQGRRVVGRRFQGALGLLERDQAWIGQRDFVAQALFSAFRRRLS